MVLWIDRHGYGGRDSKYIDQVNTDKKAHGKRALRCDAVTGIEMIEKPPMEYIEKLSREEQIRFLKTSSDVMDQILKDWKPDWITVAQVIHFDEFGGKAPHTHRIVVPLTKDKDGVLAFNAKAEFNHLNAEVSSAFKYFKTKSNRPQEGSCMYRTRQTWKIRRW